ncbi:putative lipoprotein YajG [Sinobacterium caligoides]|uniref:Putative lipoprotein YajG n=1 Tax=Sinobacterium caligoides TaxID=933926 RepID=A0A3N2DPE0_9GAMM|nr:YajG family lipoprotein [Sinobacterium caligoides]ROS01519.1 putative lipoprotein YajG [Sinobacterium caligoides]
MSRKNQHRAFYYHLKKCLPLLAVCTVLLTGCAQSPQQLSLNPDVAAVALANAAVVATVHSRDDRGTETVGSRGGVYKQSSLITTPDDFAQRLADAYATALQQSGAVSLQAEAPLQITVALNKFAISTPERSVLPEISYSAQISIEAVRGGEKRTYRYSVTQTHKLPQVPSDSKNQALVDDLFNELLRRAVVDEGLNQFIVAG